MKILLLEDDVALNRAIKKVTEIDKHNTVCYMDGQDVLENLDEQYDLYILDINVPNINGLELLNLIYKKDNSAQVLMISANAEINSLQKAYAFGCVDYLKKPFHLEELRIKIEKLAYTKKDLCVNIQLKNATDTLTKKEKELLALLVEKQSKTLTYAMIEERIYKDKCMSMDGLRALVKRLRAKLTEDKIRNVLDEGYCYENRE